MRSVASPDGVRRDAQVNADPAAADPPSDRRARGLASCYLAPDVGSAESAGASSRTHVGLTSPRHPYRRRAADVRPTDDKAPLPLARVDLAAGRGQVQEPAHRRRELPRLRPEFATTLPRRSRRGSWPPGRDCPNRGFCICGPRRTGHEPAPLPAVGSAGACGHGDRGWQEPYCRSDGIRLRQPIPPGRQVQVDVRAQRFTASGDGADPADTVATRPNTIDSSMDSNGRPSTSRR